MKKERGADAPETPGMFYEPVPGNQWERTLSFRRRRGDFSGFRIPGTCARFFPFAALTSISRGVWRLKCFRGNWNARTFTFGRGASCKLVLPGVFVPLGLVPRSGAIGESFIWTLKDRSLICFPISHLRHSSSSTCKADQLLSCKTRTFIPSGVFQRRCAFGTAERCRCLPTFACRPISYAGKYPFEVFPTKSFSHFKRLVVTV